MEVGLDIENMEKALDKINIYKKEEDITYDEISKAFENFRSAYDTDNTSKIVEKEKEFTNKFKILVKLHEGNSYVIRKNIENYIITAKKNSKIFENIKTDIGE